MKYSLTTPTSTHKKIVAYDTPPLAQAAIQNQVPLKHRYPIFLPLDESELSPHKKPKSLLTSVRVWLCQIDVLTVTIGSHADFSEEKAGT